jgi:hypothetical protein
MADLTPLFDPLVDVTPLLMTPLLIEPDVACRMFYDGGFSWQMQGQAGLLLPFEAPTPNLDRKSLRLLIADGRVDAPARIGLNDTLGLLRPGVDGAVAGLWSFDRALTRALLARLESEAVQIGFEFRLVSETTFADLLAN